MDEERTVEVEPTPEDDRELTEGEMEEVVGGGIIVKPAYTIAIGGHQSQEDEAAIS